MFDLIVEKFVETFSLRDIFGVFVKFRFTFGPNANLADATLTSVNRRMIVITFFIVIDVL